MKLNGKQVFDLVESLKYEGKTAKQAFELVSVDAEAKPATVQAAYYAHRNSLNPPKAESLAGQLRALASQVQDMEDRDEQVQTVLSQLPR